MTSPNELFISQETHWQALYTVAYALRGTPPAYPKQKVFDLWIRMVLSKKPVEPDPHYDRAMKIHKRVAPHD